MTAAEQILDFLRSHPGEQTTADISAACECSQGTVYTSMSQLVASGEITRVRMGVYQLTSGAKKVQRAPAEPEPIVPPSSASEEPADAEEAESTIELLEPLNMGIWSTGELTLARGEQTILLAPAEVREMVQFLDRVGAVPAAAVDDAT